MRHHGYPLSLKGGYLLNMVDSSRCVLLSALTYALSPTPYPLITQYITQHSGSGGRNNNSGRNNKRKNESDSSRSDYPDKRKTAASSGGAGGGDAGSKMDMSVGDDTGDSKAGDSNTNTNINTNTNTSLELKSMMYLGCTLHKQNMDHMTAMAAVGSSISSAYSENTQGGANVVGVGGMKDKRALTWQNITGTCRQGG